MCSVTLEIHGLTLPGQGAEEDASGFTKTFPDIPCVPQMSGGLSLRLSIPTERLNIPPGFRKGGSDAGWLGTWECPLRTDSASLKSLESFRQLTSFCSSWILAASSRIVSRSSTNLRLAIVSNAEPWNRFNSSISLGLFIWASRRSRFCSDNCSWRNCWTRRSCSSHARVWSISLRWDSIIPFNSWTLTSPIRLGLKFVFLNFGSKNQREFALFVFQGESWLFRFPFRDLVFVCTN